jgi:hypothetical protein
MRSWPLLFFAIGLTGLLGIGTCGRDHQDRRIAVAYLEAWRLQDTATVRFLADPEMADALVGVVIQQDLHVALALATADPQPRLRRVEDLTFVFFPFAGKTDEGVTVVLTGTSPPRVMGSQLQPDLGPWP